MKPSSAIARGGRWLAALLATALAAPLLGGLTAQAAPVEYVFSANQAEHDVSAYRVNPGGELVPLDGSPYKVGRYPVSIAAAPDGRTVYVANQGSGSISVLRAVGDRLQELPGSPFAVGTYPDGVAVDPSGRWLLVTLEDSDILRLYALREDGGLGAMADEAATGRHPISVTLSHDGRWAVVSNFYGRNFTTYRLDADRGRLLPVGGPVETEDRPIYTAFTPDDRFLFVANYGDTTLSAYRHEGVSWVPVPGSPFFSGAQPYSVTVDPSGRFVFAANWGSHDVSAFRLDADSGRLQPLPGSPYAADWYPYAVSVDPEDRYVYVANNGAGNISAYRLDVREGRLQPVPGERFPSGLGPYGMVVSEFAAFEAP